MENNMEGQNMTNQNQQDDQQTHQQDQNQQGKTFTQEDVNRIVSERLARAKNAANGSGSDREQELDRRERQLDARERLADAGIPKDLLPLVDCSSKEKMESSINLIGSYLGQKKAPTSGAGAYRIISSGTSGNANGTGNARSHKASPEEIRAAMGLKGRK